ncbi:formate dehydrogenase accessory sulfurtransferase FdhD [Desulfovibrio inopinatus]|uniref:formate dehydrogenase accessory sulfurtransferase FdhD n=1 Tax=Desulfovibrio inopinatus TaxID=102109 RepID=UPI0004172F2D|nr:formate dehydrogenase accessory sulfurtransferase FdhD [Desulfovibrio inopinatus]
MVSTSKRQIMRHHRDMVEHFEDTLAVECGLNIVVNGRQVGRTMCTPGMDRQLVLGLLYTEGLIPHAHVVRDMQFESHDRWEMTAHVVLDEMPTSSDEDITHSTPRHAGKSVDVHRIMHAMQVMEASQDVFRRTGATHCAALFDIHGCQLGVAEDIGRHNALDKAIGSALEQDILEQAAMATISSRLSYELVKKAVAIGLTFLCGISVATSLAMDVANAHGITLIGRVRGGRMNVYTHKDRITMSRTMIRRPRSVLHSVSS